MKKRKRHDKERKLLFYCIGRSNDLSSRTEAVKTFLSQGLDWPYIIEQANYHGLSGLIFRALDGPGFEAALPGHVMAGFKKVYHATLLKNLLLWREFYSVYDALNNNGVAVVPIKGIAITDLLYQDLGARGMVDIDILIQKKDLSAAEKTLEELGYKKNTRKYSSAYYESRHCQIPFFKEGPADRVISCEAHWGLTLPRPSKFFLDDLWERVEVGTVGDRDILMLSPEDTLFSLALHLRRYNRPLSLKYIIDVSRLISRDGRDFDWGYVVDESRKNRVESTLYFALYSARKLLHAPVPDPVLNELVPGILRRRGLACLVSRYTFSSDLTDDPVKRTHLYLLLRYLLYDRTWDFMSFVLFIPVEEFARFYSLSFPSSKTSMLYRWRYAYIPFRIFVSLFTKL